MNTGNFLTPVKDFISDPFRLFPNRMERLFEEPLAMFRPLLPMEENYWPVKAWTPACDIFETDKELVVKFELPEVKKEDVEVKIEQNVLTLRGERKFEQKPIARIITESSGAMVSSCAASTFPCTSMLPKSTPSSRTACLP